MSVVTFSIPPIVVRRILSDSCVSWRRRAWPSLKRTQARDREHTSE
jgi:hypothetical protein